MEYNTDLSENKKKIKEKIKDAELVLVALGDEFDGENLCRTYSEYEDHAAKLANLHLEWVFPYLNRYYLSRAKSYQKALQNLRDCLDSKNYFILSLAMSGCVHDIGLKEERIVDLCGSVYETISEADMAKREALFEKLNACIEKKSDWEDFAKEWECGELEGVTFNTLYAENFKEEAHKENWERYLKWLQGSVNRKICILELGVGMRYIGVVRLRMEKICEMNQKAFLIRVHQDFYQTPLQIFDKAKAISANSYEFMEKWNEIC